MRLPRMLAVTLTGCTHLVCLSELACGGRTGLDSSAPSDAAVVDQAARDARPDARADVLAPADAPVGDSAAPRPDGSAQPDADAGATPCGTMTCSAGDICVVSGVGECVTLGGACLASCDCCSEVCGEQGICLATGQDAGPEIDAGCNFQTHTCMALPPSCNGTASCACTSQLCSGCACVSSTQNEIVCACP